MSADEAALLRSMVALVRQRYGLDEIEAAAYVVEMPSRIKALEAENAALRARAVPEFQWARPTKIVGFREGKQLSAVVLTANVGEVTAQIVKRWTGQKLYFHWEICWMRGFSSDIDGAKSACEAAFLRLVGCKNG